MLKSNGLWTEKFTHKGNTHGITKLCFDKCLLFNFGRAHNLTDKTQVRDVFFFLSESLRVYYRVALYSFGKQPSRACGEVSTIGRCCININTRGKQKSYFKTVVLFLSHCPSSILSMLVSSTEFLEFVRKSHWNYSVFLREDNHVIFHTSKSPFTFKPVRVVFIL